MKKLPNFKKKRRNKPLANNKTFQASAKVAEYEKKAREYEKAVETALQRLQHSPLGVEVQDALNKVTNRAPFTYDINADGLYQQYKNQYQTLGKQAMQNTQAKAAEKTGGYGNSYGVTAGMEAYTSYLNRLNDMVPQLYELAYRRYQNHTNQLMEEYQLARQAQNAYNQQWQQQADRYGDLASYYANLGHQQLTYETDLWQNAVERADAMHKWEKEYALALQKLGKTQDNETDDLLLKTSGKWGAGEWEAYFAKYRNKYGSQKAMEAMRTMVSNGLLPQNMISFAIMGAQGAAKGH